MFWYSKQDLIEIAVDAELWLCLIRGKLAIMGEEIVLTSSSERKLMSVMKNFELVSKKCYDTPLQRKNVELIW